MWLNEDLERLWLRFLDPRENFQWYESRIRKLHIIADGCRASKVMEKKELDDLLSFVNCNQTIAAKSAYGVVLYHLNEGNGRMVNDSFNENVGQIHGNYSWVR